MQGMRRAGLPAAAPFSRRPLAPLTLTLGLHLVLVLAWPGGAGRQPIGATPPEPAFVPVLRLAGPQPLPTVRQASPGLRPRANEPAEAAPVAVPTPLTPMPRPEPEPITQAPAAGGASAPAIELASELAPEPALAPASARAAAPASAPDGLLATSKAMAGPVDRALRNGASPITAEPDRKWERFAQAFAAARTGSVNTVTLDSHTAADGVVTYRKTAGNRVACYRSGSVGGPATVFGRPLDNQGAGSVPCPTGVRWARQ